MIKSIHLKWFRRHEELHIDFSTGLNVLRGNNESGKSTTIEGVLYALYGAKALRDSLAETVTWGHKESELWARAVISINNIDYVFTRSKSGAECVYAGADGKPVKVTGQNEVTSFSADLLGADARTAGLLMLSSQSGIRGALDDGPTAVSGLMGKLADFDLIDRLVAAADEKLLTGSAVPFQAKLAAAEAEVVAATEALPDEHLADGFEELRLNYVAQIAEIQGRIDGDIAANLKAAETAYVEGKLAWEKYNAIRESISTLLGQIETVERNLATARAVAASAPPPETIQKLRDQVEQEKNLAALMSAHVAVTGLPKYPEVFWDQSKSTLVVELERLRAEEARLAMLARDENVAANNVRKGVITSGKCPTCGHAHKSDEDIKAHNDNVAAAAAVHDAKYKEHIAAKALLAPDIAAMTKLLKDGAVFEELGKSLFSKDVPISIDVDVYPPKITWTGAVPSVVNQGATKRALQDLLELEREATVATGRVETLVATLAGYNLKGAALEADAQAVVLPKDLEALRAAYHMAVGARDELVGRVDTLKTHAAGAERQRDEAKRAYEAGKARLANAQARVVECQEDLKKLARNNQLVTKLKKLKPMITDSLWNTVLAAVSNFFSTLRGEKSLVTKSPNGFKVNGQSVESLSGSTIDVLALAIRVALTKTFIPHASFMVLDEPAHGCDTTRTASVLGFLSSVGFAQTLLASHDELSEAVADNVIALGA